MWPECPRATVPLPTLRTTSGPESLDSFFKSSLRTSQLSAITAVGEKGKTVCCVTSDQFIESLQQASKNLALLWPLEGDRDFRPFRAKAYADYTGLREDFIVRPSDD